MKAIDELRRLPDFGTVIIDGDETGLTETMVCVTRAQLNAISDAIERELEEEYVPLPKDANGEAIHIGDRVENNKRVVRITLTDGSWEPSVYVEEAPCRLTEFFCNEVSHYHEPTVEDVLREFALKCEDAGNAGPEVERIASEFAERLQLREEGE